MATESKTPTNLSNTKTEGTLVSTDGYDPLDKWETYIDKNPTNTNYSPNNINSLVDDTKGIDDLLDSNSDWYFDKIFENPYLVSTLYFNNNDFKDNKDVPNSKFMALGRCITRASGFSVDNRFDQVGATPFSRMNTAMFRNLKQIVAFDKSPFGMSMKNQTSLLEGLFGGQADGYKKDGENDFWTTICYNALKVVRAISNSMHFLNSVQFESDAGFARSFMASSVTSPVHATFFFLQDKDVKKHEETNRYKAAKLLSYMLPYQKLYTSWWGGQDGKNEGALLSENPDMADLVNDIEAATNDIAAKINAEKILGSVVDLTSSIFSGGVITTHSPGGYKTDNQKALIAAEKGIPDKRTFMLTTPWGMRLNLLPSNINITESQSKVIVNGSQILPLYIQIDIDFIPSRRLLSSDVIDNVSGKYNLKNIGVKQPATTETKKKDETKPTGSSSTDNNSTSTSETPAK